MTQKEMLKVSVYTILFTLLTQATPFFGFQLFIQLILVVVMAYRLKPYQTFFPTVINLLTFFLIALPVYDLNQASLSNIFLNRAFSFNLAYVLTTYLMSKYLRRESPDGVPYNPGINRTTKVYEILIALLIGVGLAVFIGGTYSVILEFIFL